MNLARVAPKLDPEMPGRTRVDIRIDLTGRPRRPDQGTARRNRQVPAATDSPSQIYARECFFWLRAATLDSSQWAIPRDPVNQFNLPGCARYGGRNSVQSARVSVWLAPTTPVKRPRLVSRRIFDKSTKRRQAGLKNVPMWETGCLDVRYFRCRSYFRLGGRSETASRRCRLVENAKTTIGFVVR